MFRPPLLAASIVVASFFFASPQALFAQDKPEQDRKPTSRPASRPAAKPLTDRERLRPADWGEGAPGRAVMRQKFLPIKSARYTTPDKLRAPVRDKDIVIGLVVGGKAVAYPISMLGGPQREIINEDFAGVRFCVNW